LNLKCIFLIRSDITSSTIAWRLTALVGASLTVLYVLLCGITKLLAFSCCF